MLSDIRTVMWKELREIVFPDGRFQGGARNVIVFVLVAGLVFPLQTGASYVTSWAAVQTACFPVILVLNYAVDAFAGERERHTLETLLASRLADRSILFGKILAIVAYVWMLILACQIVTTVGLNLAYRGNGLIFYRPAILVSVLGVGLLAAFLFCSLGVLVSIGAPTVRAAGQRMIAPFLLLVGLPAFAPAIIRRFHWEASVARLSGADVVLVAAAWCALLSALLLALALRRFTRERLVLA